MIFRKGRLSISFSLLILLILPISACQNSTSQNTASADRTPDQNQASHSTKAHSAQQCKQHELALQVLGSGGPIADDDRASSAYLLWHQGKSVALIDFGGGAFQRFGAAGGQLDDLEFIALSHLHTDHSAGLPALMKSAYFSKRTRPLSLFGPDDKHDENGNGQDQFPALPQYLESLFAPKQGAYRYLSGLLNEEDTDGLFLLNGNDVSAAEGKVSHLEVAGPVSLTAMGVHHGIVPALAFRLSVDGKDIVFAGDQSRFNPAMAEFSAGAQVLVAHMAIPQDAGNIAKRLHRTPQSWGELGSEAHVEQMVLSHWMQRSLRNQSENVEWVQKNFSGPVHIASDLDCIVL